MRKIAISVLQDVTRDHATRCHDICSIFVVADGVEQLNDTADECSFLASFCRMAFRLRASENGAKRDMRIQRSSGRSWPGTDVLHRVRGELRMGTRRDSGWCRRCGTFPWVPGPIRPGMR